MTQPKDPKELYNRTYQLEQELITLKEDLREIKGEFTFHKEFSPGGLDKDVVKKIMKAARAQAAQDNLRGKADELNEIAELQEKYSA
jgi:uncharacterized protein (UPF0335 family)